MSGFEEIINDLKTKRLKDFNGILFYLAKVSDFQQKEIKFHNAIHQDEEEIHQLNTVRNQFYHSYFIKWLYKLPKDSVILEIGAGSGYDLIPLLKQGYSVIVSDISEQSVKSIKSKIDNQYPQFRDKVIYLVTDGQNLPFDNNLIDAVYMSATLHHFENQAKLLSEIKRVTKKSGLIIFAMEPSRFMMWFTKLFSNSKSLRVHDGQSEADKTHQGYTKNDIKKIVIGHNSSVIRTKRVWLLLGFLHYGLEALYRIFKLKKRVEIVRFIEWLLLILDEILLKIPIINQLNWHWIVILRNN